MLCGATQDGQVMVEKSGRMWSTGEGKGKPTLSDPMDCSLPGSSIHGIFQARVLEWGAIAFSKFSMMITLNEFPDDAEASGPGITL